MSDEELEALSDLLDQHQQQKSVQEGTGYYQESKDFDFHFRIVKGSRNVRLVQMLCEDLYYLLRVYRYKSSTKPGRAKQALREHKDIVAALKRRDPVEAETKMRLHIANARQYVEEQVKEAASRPPVPATKPKIIRTPRSKEPRVAMLTRR
jgi:DNA-binding GntR family transcriptional regulator